MTIEQIAAKKAEKAKNIETVIWEKIQAAPVGQLFFIDDFIVDGAFKYKAAAKSLERLVSKAKLKRIDRGMYAITGYDPISKEVLPRPQDIAKAVCRKYNVRAVPAGKWAVYLAGLSTQHPGFTEYLTSGKNRRFHIGKSSMLFRSSSGKNVACIGQVSSLVIQALKAIGPEKITLDQVRLAVLQLRKESPYALEHDIGLAPEWIRVIGRMALNG